MKYYRRLPIMMHTIDSEGRLIDVNDAWCERMQYTRDQVLGRLSLDFLTPMSRDRVIHAWLPALWQNKVVRNVPIKMVNRVGEVIEIELTAIVVEDVESGMMKCCAILNDVTERNRVLQDLLSHEDEKVRRIAVTLGAMPES